MALLIIPLTKMKKVQRMKNKMIKKTKMKMKKMKKTKKKMMFLKRRKSIKRRQWYVLVNIAAENLQDTFNETVDEKLAGHQNKDIQEAE